MAARGLLDKQRLGELIDLVGTIGLGDKAKDEPRVTDWSSSNNLNPLKRLADRLARGTVRRYRAGG